MNWRIVICAAAVLAAVPAQAQHHRALLPAVRALSQGQASATMARLPAQQQAHSATISLRQARGNNLSSFLPEYLLPQKYVQDQRKNNKKGPSFQGESWEPEWLKDLEQRMSKMVFSWQYTRRLEKEMMSVQNEISLILRQNKHFMGHWKLHEVFTPMKISSEFALRNNKTILFFLRKFFEKVAWLNALPSQGKNELGAALSADVVQNLAQRLSNENLIMLGEFHYFEEVFHTVDALMDELKRQNPNRRIVLFTEFIGLRVDAGIGSTAEEYYRPITDAPRKLLETEVTLRVPYARGLFESLLKKQIEIYPLEDFRQQKMLWQEEHFGKPALLSIILRDRLWARLIRAKMAEIRQTDPDALFVVYAGQGHTSWLMPYALPKFFADESPAVVEITPGRMFRFNTLYPVWGADAPVFAKHTTPTLYYWKGNSAELFGKQTGFDYALVVPAQ